MYSDMLLRKLVSDYKRSAKELDLALFRRGNLRQMPWEIRADLSAAIETGYDIAKFCSAEERKHANANSP
jgi:hypothetical protein|tara:strand:+ start:610 stop:819 length:210 start_codon:yes stop_codon:yes gene_type:complete